MILNDQEICQLGEYMILPFESKQVRTKKLIEGIANIFPEKVISYGCSSFGYDIRISDEFKIFTNINNSIIDPKDFDKNSFVDFKGNVCIMPPHSFVLAKSFEVFDMPRDVMAICVGKSTYARCGLIVNVTPLEPEWRGVLTIEISNTTSLPAKLYANEGIAQLIFFRGNPPANSYADKNGKYQNQIDITLAKV